MTKREIYKAALIAWREAAIASANADVEMSEKRDVLHRKLRPEAPHTLSGFVREPESAARSEKAAKDLECAEKALHEARMAARVTKVEYRADMALADPWKNPPTE